MTKLWAASPVFLVFFMLAGLAARAQQSLGSPPSAPSAGKPAIGLSSLPRGELPDRHHLRVGKAGSAAPLFLPAVGYNPDNIFPNAIAVGDVNNDGVPDIVIVGQSCNEYYCGGNEAVLLGNGDGTFRQGTSYESGSYPVSVVLTDVNGDGNLDLIFSDTNNMNVNVMLGNGNGTFQSAVSYSSGSYDNVANVVAADVNGDGILDLLVLNQCADEYCDSSVAVFIGNGNGTFQPAAKYPTGAVYGQYLAVADLSGNGILDLAVSNGFLFNTEQGAVNVAMGNGDGSFQAASAPYNSGGIYPIALSVADVNGDGKPDLVVANQYTDWSTFDGPGTYSVLLGNGDGTFQPAVSYGLSSLQAHALAVADVNGDGKLDAVVGASIVNFGGGPIDGPLQVMLGNGNGTFQPPVSFDSGGSGPHSIAIADLNGDGLPDIVVASIPDFADGLSYYPIRVLLNGGGTTIPTAATVSSSLSPSIYGQSVTFTTTVSSGSGEPSGAALFIDAAPNGYMNLGTPSLENGTTSVSSSAMPVGSQTILVSYQPASNFGYSTALVSQIVNPAATTTSLTSSINPVGLRKNVTYTATVTGQYAAAGNGTVAFQDGGVTVFTAYFGPGNQATFSTSYPTPGIHTITAVYSGNSNSQGSTSSVVTEEAGNVPYPTTTKVTTSASPSHVGQPVTFTAAVSSDAGVIPNGEVVAFEDGSDTIGTATTTAGLATFTTSSLTDKTHTIKASYAGDSFFKKSSGTAIQVVDGAPTTTTLESSLNPSSYGQTVTWTATVTSTGSNIPTGKVKFTGIGTASLSGGVATLSKTWLNAAAYAITAEYQGDDYNAISDSNELDQVVNPASTTTTLLSSANPSTQGQAVMFTATVTTSTGVNSAGTVTFTAAGTTLGTATLANNVASLSTSSLPIGTTVVQATYNGETDFMGSSTMITQTVNP